MVMTMTQLTLVFPCTRVIADEEVDDHQLVGIGGRKMADIGGNQLGQVVGEKERRVDVT